MHAFARPATGASSCVALLVLLVGSLSATADTTSQSLPFTQNWTDTGLITANDDWSGVPGVIGYRGDGLTAANDVDPRTVVAESTGINVLANLTKASNNTGGVAEFELANPTLRFRGRHCRRAPRI